MEVRIGISDVSREVTLRTEANADDVIEALNKAIADNSVFEMTDAQGRARLQGGIPGSRFPRRARSGFRRRLSLFALRGVGLPMVVGKATQRRLRRLPAACEGMCPGLARIKVSR